MFTHYVHVDRGMVRALQWRGSDGRCLLDHMQERSGCSLRIVTADLDLFAPGNEQTALIAVINDDKEKAEDGADIVSNEMDQLNRTKLERPLPPRAVSALFRDGKYMLKELRALTDCYMYVSHGNPSKIIVLGPNDHRRGIATHEIKRFLSDIGLDTAPQNNYWYRL